MAFEGSALDVEGKGKKVLGRFSDESLGFRICYSQSSIYCEEENLHFRVPLILPSHLPSGGSPDSWQTFLRCCFGKFLERHGLQVFPKLSGGGAGRSNQRRNDPLRYAMNKARHSNDENQQLACKIAEEVKDLARKGITSGMRLATLEALPQVTITAPYTIAKSLLDALKEQALWSLPTNYLVRATIARLARRYMMDHIFLDRVAFFSSVNAELNDILKEVISLATLRDETWLESGVLVQCNALSMLIKYARSSERWWTTLPSAAKTLFDAYTSRNPLQALPLILDIITQVKSMAGRKHVIELQLQVDKIYSSLGGSNPDLIDRAVLCIEELLHLGKSWKTLYTTLTCLEWAIHKNMLLEPHINKLRPRIEELTSINSVRVREKVASILIKLSQKGWLTDLLDYMKREEEEDRISALFELAPEELYVESNLSLVTNIQNLMSFTGRESELQQIREQLKTSNIVKIVGPAGSGKTALANAFAIALANTFEIVWKCSADTETNLASDLKRLETKLNIGDDFSELLGYLNSRRVLLLLDNLESNILHTFPELLKGKIRVIITSRNAVQENTLPLGGLDPRIAADFVIRLTERNDEREDIETLCQDLSYLPLALQNVSALLNFNDNERVATIIEWIRERPSELEVVDSENGKMMTLLEKCVEKVTSELGKRLLLITLDLSPDIIPELLYKKIFNGKDADLRQAKYEAMALSLINEDESHNLSLHRLVQQAIRSCSADLARELLPAKIRAFLELFDYKEHSELSVNLSKSIECVITTIKLKSVPEPAEVSLCIRFVSFCMEQLGNVKAVSDLCHLCISWWEKSPIVTEQNVLDVQTLAECCSGIANWELAEQYINQVIAFLLTGNNRETLAGSYNSLANFYFHQFKLGDAEEFYLMSLKIREEALPPTHPKLAASYNNLANVYYKQDNFEGAEEYYMKSLKINETVLPPTHHSLATSYYNLANFYFHQDNLSGAKEFHLKALSIRKEALPPTHPKLAASYNNLANVYYKQDNFEGAEEYYMKSLKIYETVLPSKHCDFATLYSGLANVYFKQENLKLAEQFSWKALSIREAVLSPQHPDLASSYYNHATIYLALRNFEAAEEFHLKALKIREAVLPSTHVELAGSYTNLAKVYSERMKLGDAEQLCLKALKIYEAVLPPTHCDLATSYMCLADVYYTQGKAEKAEEFYQKTLKIRERDLPSTNPNLANSYMGLANAYLDQGKLEAAEKFHLKALEIREGIPSPLDPDLAISYMGLGNVYYKQKKLREAEEFHLKALKIREEVLPCRHPHLANSYKSLARDYEDQGKLSDAAELRKLIRK